jgi:hypothetical protein
MLSIVEGMLTIHNLVRHFLFRNALLHFFLPSYVPGGYFLGSVRKIITRGVSHSGLVIYIKKYFNAKKELWKLK